MAFQYHYTILNDHLSMSRSPTCNLYCNESADDVVSFEFDAEMCNNSYESFNSLNDVDDENYISNVFDSEVDQMQGSELLAQYRKLPGIVNARQETVKWMLQMHIHCRFRPETAYLSVNYLDRFLFSRSVMPRKGWQWQLLSVTCLALAAKMEETNVPNPLDLQLIEPRRFLFKPKTLQRMELLVMSCLKWRLRNTTAFDFVHYFISKISCFRQWNGFSYVSSHASDLILRTSRVIDFLDFPPSTLAAAVVLWATNDTHNLDDQKLGCFHKRVNQDMVKRCYCLIRKNISLLLLPIGVVEKPEHVPANSKIRLVFRRSCDDPKSVKMTQNRAKTC